jgi:arylsulfatase A-like enzyme
MKKIISLKLNSCRYLLHCLTIIVVVAIQFASNDIVAQEIKPNVLYISIDDLNNWVEYMEGHPQVKTPNINRLVERGIAFTQAHCTTPLCKPSRSAILSGLNESKTKVYSNGNKFNYSEYTLLPQYFAEHGYVSYGTGKIHHSKINDKMFQIYSEPHQRWSPFSSEEVLYTEDEFPSKGTKNPRHVIYNGPGGKDYVLPFNRMPSERNLNRTSGESFDWASFDLPDEAFGDGLVTDWAIEQLKDHPSDKPFFIGIGYYRPHIPLYAPKKYFDLYPLESIQLPQVRSDDLDDIPEAGKKRALSAVTAGTHQNVIAHNQWKNAVQAYLACISFIDSQIGELLDYLDNSPYAKNTIIVFFSDHGWHLGEKQAWGKFSPWIHSTNTPFIICPAGSKTNALCHEPVSLLDIYPTLVEMAGLPETEVDGVSLVPLLNNPALDNHRVVTTYVGEDVYALSSKKWRLIHYGDGSEELYNIREDPLEFINLIDNTDYRSVVTELKKHIR